MLAGMLAYQATKSHPIRPGRGPAVKRGAEILAGPYPQTFTEFVGQDRARRQILASINSAVVRDTRMDHMLLASGLPGIGKTTLGRLCASLRRVGFVELGGVVTDKQVHQALKVMQDGDVLFLDEIHRLVARGKSNAEWLLTLLQDGELHLPTGVYKAPDITVIAATTDAQRLPETILDRFPIKPVLSPYTTEQAVEIAKVTVTRMFAAPMLVPPVNDWLVDVANACDNNPRRMGMLLTAVRDIALSTDYDNLSPRGFDIAQALHWQGLTEDGLTQGMQDYLVALYAYGGTAGVATLKALLSESEITHTEKHLIQKGYVIVHPRGRELTDYGTDRAAQLATAQLEAR